MSSIALDVEILGPASAGVERLLEDRDLAAWSNTPHHLWAHDNSRVPQHAGQASCTPGGAWSCSNAMTAIRYRTGPGVAIARLLVAASVKPNASREVLSVWNVRCRSPTPTPTQKEKAPGGVSAGFPCLPYTPRGVATINRTTPR
jgi:hypothetical protein